MPRRPKASEIAAVRTGQKSSAEDNPDHQQALTQWLRGQNAHVPAYSPTAVDVLGIATVVYSAAVVVRPDVLIGPSQLADSVDTRLLTRVMGVRDVGIGAAMVLAPAGAARQTALTARVLADWGDAVLFGARLRGRNNRWKVVGAAAGWGLLCGVAGIAAERRRR